MLTDGAAAPEALSGDMLECAVDCKREQCTAKPNGCSGKHVRWCQGRSRKVLQHLPAASFSARRSFAQSRGTGNSWESSRLRQQWQPAGQPQKRHGGRRWCLDQVESYPASCNNSHHERIAKYVQAWGWAARRHGLDLFAEMGAAARPARCSMRVYMFFWLKLRDVMMTALGF